MLEARQIVHLDLDAFFCSVEEKRDPGLQGKAFAVGARPEQRGVVASCSYPARKRGVRSAMPMGQALRLCPELVIVAGRYSEYAENSRQVMARLRAVTPLVEQISIDEAFIDVSEMDESPEDIARRLQAQIRTELALPSSLGVAGNKLVAKIASDYGKKQFQGSGPPCAITVVPPGEEAAFLAPLPVRALWGVGPRTEERLHAMAIRTIGELASVDPQLLVERFGRHGAGMARRAAGIDLSPVVTHHEAKSISQEITFSRDVRDGEPIRAAVRKQVGRVAAALRERELTASTVRIKIRWPDFTTLTRQMTISSPTDDPALIEDLAWRLVKRVWKPGKAVRLIGVGVSGLGERPGQLALWSLLENGME